MKKINDVSIVLLSAVIFTFLFHRQALGLNLFLFEGLFFLWLIINKQFRLKGLYPISIGLGFILSSAFTVIHHSAYTFVIHFLFAFAFIGVLIYPQARSLITSLGLATTNLYRSQKKFVKDITSSKLKGKSLGRHLVRLSIYIIPLVIIIIFILIYRNSNPVFNELLNDIGSFFNLRLTAFFAYFDTLILLTLFLGMLFSSFIYIRVREKVIINADANSSEFLKKPVETDSPLKPKNALLNEYRSGIFLFLILNAILLVLNVIDVKWVWFNFEWEGQYLKQFVHEGTYLLILSILLSMALVLFYFRGKLNFYENNKLLKFLSLIWLAQNAVLAVSVAIRNYWYIEYFALAYKRIGVFIFLIIVIFGLYTILTKVLHRKSAFYLLKTNVYAVLLVLLLTSFVNWDTVIARYNFSHAEKSFLHLDFMAGLSDKALPYLDKSLPELNEIDRIQQEAFPFTETYMSPDAFYITIDKRKQVFKRRWKSKSFLSWNLAEFLAYQKLF
jgi:hypothetical protein